MILDRETAAKKLHRMALEVAERNHDKTELILAGIRENGVFIAERIRQHLSEIFKGNITVVDILLDKKMPGDICLSTPVDFSNKSVLLIDDVANSGRTMLYALKPILQQIPQQVETLALVERTHKKFPIAVDYVGLSVSTTLQENIVVKVDEGDILGAWLQ